MFFFSSRRRHTSWPRDWSSDVCSSDLEWVCTVTTPQPTAQSADVRVGLGVSTIRSASDFAVDREFFAHFGFSPGAVANEWFEGLVGEGATGMLGLHHASPDTPTHRQTGMG